MLLEGLVAFITGAFPEYAKKKRMPLLKFFLSLLCLISSCFALAIVCTNLFDSKKIQWLEVDYTVLGLGTLGLSAFLTWVLAIRMKSEK